MKNLFIILLLLPAFNGFAQTGVKNSNETIAFNNPPAFQLHAQDFYTPPPRGRQNCTNGLTVTGNILAGIGGALIGWPLGTAIGGGDPEWALAGIGAGFLAIGIPVAVIGQKRCSGGRYSSVPGNTDYVAYKKKLELGLVATGNTVGLRLNF